jgi:hypothetical protein
MSKYNQEIFFDFSMIASMKEERKNFQTRRDICQWLKQGSFSRGGMWSRRAQCPALRANPNMSFTRVEIHGAHNDWWTQYWVAPSPCLQVRNNIYHSSRLYSMARPFLYLINVSWYEAFSNDLEDILRRPESEYQDKLRLVAQNTEMFWIIQRRSPLNCTHGQIFLPKREYSVWS